MNERNAEAHAQAGYAAVARNQWHLATRQFAQAVVDSDLGNLNILGRGQVNYEYGRALGVVCKYDESEKYLLRSKLMAEQAGKAPYLSLYELALLNEKRGMISQSAEYFKELIPIMEREGLRSSFPLGVADAYERYASDLIQLGRPNEAAIALDESRAIRTANPSAKSFGRITPYGTACDDSA